jgi:hypothetical protein
MRTVTCLALLAAATLTGCGDDASQPVGSANQCEKRLERKMTDRYLRSEHEIASITALAKATQIARTCDEVPSNFSVDDAATLAGGEMRNAIR